MNQIIKVADFNPESFFKNVGTLKNPRGNPAGNKRNYMAILTAFDIETTSIEDISQSFMYIWQWQFSTEVTVIGRYWEEFLNLQKRIKTLLPEGYWIAVYVHNLSYEFSFLKGIYPFTNDEVFALQPRKILKCDMHGCFEFRCSYLQTNMTLAQFTKKMNVEHKKLDGDEFNYSEKRYPWTELTDRELEYCVNDVLGLVEALQTEMESDGDTIKTIPLTSTGYVRRNCKRAMRAIDHNFVPSILPDIEVYEALREAFRGGNTHANRFYADEIIYNVHSADRSSSYPAVMCNCEYPMTKFTKVLDWQMGTAEEALDYITDLMTIRHKAVLARIRMEKVELRNKFWGCPYLSKDKCRNIINASQTEDNGRILEADSLETTVTDIDLKILLEEYTAKITILDAWFASYKPLPKPLVNEVISYYKKKTELKNVKGQEIYYEKSKNLLNALYGMMAQSPVKQSILFDLNHKDKYGNIEQFSIDKSQSDEELLIKSNKKAFLAYQWGVWVTAHSRFELEKGIRKCHENGAKFIYCDTDSCKYVGNVNWDDYNKEKYEECLKSGSYATDPKGVTHYMGTFESEDNENGYAYYQFKTLGAKKYCYVEKPYETVHCTIAGVNKKKGAKELQKNGGIKAFKEGFVFHEAGGLEAVYNDIPEIDHIEIDGKLINLTSNVCLRPSSYTVGITGAYERIIKYAKNYLDNPYVI